MDFMTLAKKRCSIRAYTDRKVEPEKLAQILEAARIAPTAKNLQPLKLLAVQSEEGLVRIGKAANVYGAPLAIVVCADRDRNWIRPFDGKQTGDIDASILTDHMMLQATELGLGSVWICFFKPDVLREEFALPENLEPINILAIGYAAGEHAKSDRHEVRVPLDQLVAYEHL